MEQFSMNSHKELSNRKKKMEGRHKSSIREMNRHINTYVVNSAIRLYPDSI